VYIPRYEIYRFITAMLPLIYKTTKKYYFMCLLHQHLCYISVDIYICYLQLNTCVVSLRFEKTRDLENIKSIWLIGLHIFLCFDKNELLSDFKWVLVAQSLVFCVMLCRSLFVLFRLAIVLAVLLTFTAYDYPFVIFKHL
jgi:hypothetical protein